MNDSPQAVPLSRAIRNGLLRQAYRHQPGSILVSVSTALGIAILASRDGLSDIWAWFAAMLLVAFGRMLVQFAFLRYAPIRGEAGDVAPVWQRLVVAGQLLSGLMWAIMPPLWLLRMQSDTRYATLIVLSALAGGATGVLAPLPVAGRIFIALVLLPSTVMFYFTTPPQPVLALLALVFLVVMIFGLRNNYLALRESLRLRAENADLVDSLRQRSRETEELNQRLEEKVLARTAELARMAGTDMLTGLPNRRRLMEELEARIAGDEPLGVLLVDLVRFKLINNRLGHEAGDEVLVAVAERLRAALASDQFLARWGGDEFIVLVPGGAMGARQALQMLRKALVMPVRASGELQVINFYAGVAIEGQHGNVGSDLLSAADLALTELKRLGRGYFLFYRGELAMRQRRRLDLAFDVLQAGERKELYLVYQPIVLARNGRVDSLEAMLRWQHPRFGNVPPDEFVPLVEESAAINSLGLWVLRRACTDARQWAEDVVPRVAVNVSVIQLRDPLFVQNVTEVLGQTGLAPSRLDIEVTESVFEPANAERVSLTLAALSAMGIRIHVDDFGTGYSSLSRLHALPIDAIKIDRSFVAGLDTGAAPVIEGAILIARRFGLATVAEGVETLSQAIALHRLGVDCFQGYFISHPKVEPRLAPVAPDWLEALATSVADSAQVRAG